MTAPVAIVPLPTDFTARGLALLREAREQLLVAARDVVRLRSVEGDADPGAQTDSDEELADQLIDLARALRRRARAARATAARRAARRRREQPAEPPPGTAAKPTPPAPGPAPQRPAEAAPREVTQKAPSPAPARAPAEPRPAVAEASSRERPSRCRWIVAATRALTTFTRLIGNRIRLGWDRLLHAWQETSRPGRGS